MSFDYWSKRRMQYFLEKIRNVLGSAAYKNVPTAGDAGVTQVVLGNDSRLSDARTPVAHNQASNTINAMTGYSKPLSTSAITTSDTLNSAIGKLETALDGLSGSEILILHLSEDEGTGDTVCDKTPSEVLAAYQAGKVLFLLDTEYDYLYLFESYSDYDDHYIISFSKCEARYSGLIDVKTYNLTSSEDTDTWDDIDYDDTDLEFAHVEISLSNGNYTCDASPTEMSLALQYRDSLGVFLQYTEDDTVYNVSYADFTNNIYHFSTVIKDNSNNFKLRTFVLTASGSSWGSITMNEVSIASVEVVDNLTTNDGTKALSAKQGKVLNDTKQNNIWHGTTAEYTAQASSIPDGTIVDITDDEESVSQIEIVDNLTTQDATKALSANQGYVLKGLIDSKSDVFLITMTEDENDNTSYVVDKTFEEILAAVEAGKFVMLKYDYSETNEDEEYHEEYDYRNYYTLTSTENYNYYDDEDESNNYFTYEFDFNSYEYHDGHNLKYTAINGLDLSYDSYDESWFVTKYQDAEDYSSVGQIWIYNNEYQCSLNPNALRCAVLSKFSTIFLRCTVDNTMYHLTYADTINNVYYFSTIIKDNSDNFKLRTFVLTASGVSWTSITMNEVAIGGSSGGSSPSHLIIISSAGSTVEVETPSGETITATQTTGSTTQWECDTTEFGEHTITITLSSTDYTHDIDINCTESIKVIYIATGNDWIDIRSNSGKPELTMEQYNYLVENDLDEPDVDYHIKDASPVSAKNLDDLLDVQITSPSNGQTLTYESSSSKWKNKTPAFAGLWTTAVSGSVGDTTITFTDSNITTTSILDLYSENESGTPVSYTSVEISAGEAEYTIPELEEATDFKLWIRNL